MLLYGPPLALKWTRLADAVCYAFVCLWMLCWFPSHPSLCSLVLAFMKLYKWIHGRKCSLSLIFPSSFPFAFTRIFYLYLRVSITTPSWSWKLSCGDCIYSNFPSVEVDIPYIIFFIYFIYVYQLHYHLDTSGCLRLYILEYLSDNFHIYLTFLFN